jgi:hypothetical protein
MARLGWLTPPSARRGTHRVVPASLLLLAWLAPGVAAAALGDDASSVEADRTQLRAELRVTAGPAFTVHELQLANGTLVKEYLSPAGRVFAVSWSGPALPDLRQLLGASFEVYRAAPRTPDSGRSHATVSSPGLVVHSAGHPRSFAGMAYLPQWLPAGVTEEDLR